ncbi:MAG: hypothetical protein EBU96_05130 [Actinobacteria bacterium]|nr:hypothetical protein [Actinomycetota bacterium]
MQIVNWITGHWETIVALVGGIVILARIIVKITPTPKDDSALEAVVNFLKGVGLHIDEKK